jgi:predicted RNA-binding Zn-ribbon protein involved in translation (DUF1610 family)
MPDRSQPERSVPRPQPTPRYQPVLGPRTGTIASAASIEPASAPATTSEPTTLATEPLADAEATVAPEASGAEHPCPHCGADMVQHDAPPGMPKHAAWHCDACGGCWVHRGSAWFAREGHPAPAGWTGE